MSAARLLIVSNRLPVTVVAAEGRVTLEPSSGGLATGLRGPHERMGGPWIGWPGSLDDVPEEAQADLARQLAAQRLVPVPLSAGEVARYYEHYANGVLWPLFHYFTTRLPLQVMDFDEYERVNTRFADIVADHYAPGDRIWVHDYQLLLLPQMLRDRLPDARIGFFLHIPFPSSEVFRLLPQREALVEGVLGADLVGFHTAGYLRHFASSVLRLTSAALDVDRIRWRHGDVRLGVFPMGVDAARIAACGDSEEVARLVADHRQEGTKLLVGIDRLDYTKGIPRRLRAFRTMLRRHPELCGKVRLVQVAVPSREKVDAYRRFGRDLDALVGSVHGEFATSSWSPVHYLHRGLSEAEVVALYRAADAVLVTPLRDGMNLVAKEFVAARTDGDGVLVLSELAGAAEELSEALRVNPYDIERTADAFHRALTMPEEERRTRMAVLRERVMRHTVDAWARSFLAQLERAEPAASSGRLSSATVVRAVVEAARRARRLVLLLDYDGTLVRFVPSPELAVPDGALLALLARLAARPGTEVHLVSGRRRSTIDRWFGRLPLGLWAEHGLWTRSVGAEWRALEAPDLRWREPVLAILRDFTDRTPGALVEEKTAGVAWHYRGADPEFGAAQARELSLHLTSLLSNAPVELLVGTMVLEVRPHGIDKGRAARDVLARAPSDALLVALGDDRTDEDLFAALPPGGIAVHVGPSESRAPVRIADVAAARSLLARIAEDHPGDRSPA